MGSVGAPEILVVLFIALLVLGPDRLPGAARSVGKAVGEFRRVTGGIQAEMRDAVDGIINPTEPEPTPSTAATAIPAVTVDPMPAAEPVAPVLADDDTSGVHEAAPVAEDSAAPDVAPSDAADPAVPIVGTTSPAGGLNPVVEPAVPQPFDPSLN